MARVHNGSHNLPAYPALSANRMNQPKLVLIYRPWKDGRLSWRVVCLANA